MRFATKFAATLVRFRGFTCSHVKEVFCCNIPFSKIGIGIFWDNLVDNVITDYIGQLEI